MLRSISFVSPGRYSSAVKPKHQSTFCEGFCRKANVLPMEVGQNQTTPFVCISSSCLPSVHQRVRSFKDSSRLMNNRRERPKSMSQRMLQSQNSTNLCCGRQAAGGTNQSFSSCLWGQIVSVVIIAIFTCYFVLLMLRLMCLSDMTSFLTVAAAITSEPSAIAKLALTMRANMASVVIGYTSVAGLDVA